MYPKAWQQNLKPLWMLTLLFTVLLESAWTCVCDFEVTDSYIDATCFTVLNISLC